MTNETLRTKRNELRHSLLGTAPGIMLSRRFTVMYFVVLVFSLGCGGGSSGGSGGSGGEPPDNPTPEIISLSPNSVTAGGAAFTLTITGENFITSSKVYWNGNAVTATYSASNQMQAQIPANDISDAGTASVSVVNPSPGGGTSGSAEFTINPSSNPSPSLTLLTPAAISAGSSDFLLTIGGSGFVSESTIEWNGSPIATTFLSDGQLQAQIPASSVASAGFVNVSVSSPAPGGGQSSFLIFEIDYVPTIVGQLSNNLVWDSTNQVIYLSSPSLASSNGNTITVLNPQTGTIQASQFAGSEPDSLAISDDDQFLYAGLDGASSVQRFTLPDLQPDIEYALGAGQYSGPCFAVDVQVAPGLPHTTAVSRGFFNQSPVGYCGMAIYDDATQRPTTSEGQIYDSLQWGTDSAIFSVDNEGYGGINLYVLAVNSKGVVESKDYTFGGAAYTNIHYDSGTKLVYTDDGYAINPNNGQDVGNFSASGLMVPDSSLNSAFFLGQTQFQGGTTHFTIESFNLTTFAPIAELPIGGVQGYPLNFIRWGQSGLAFNDEAGYVYVINNSIVGGNAARSKTSQRNLTPVKRSWSRPKKASRARTIAEVKVNPSQRIRRQLVPLDSNPAPQIASLSPSTVTAGVNGFTLTVTGTDLLSFSTIEWNGTPIPTEYVSSTELQAQVTANDVSTAASVAVSVVTPSPGGGTSNTLPFSVVSGPNPVPVIVALDPNAVPVGSASLTLTVIGQYFNSSSVVEWNGAPIPSSYAGNLQVQVSASQIAEIGNAQITVTNPEPAGGVSNTAEFQILYQPTVVNQVTNDMVWDPVNQVIYMSIPGSAPTNADQVCILNPATATITNCQAAGSEPDVLAISDDSQFLYVGGDGSNLVQRFVLPGLTPDISYVLGSWQNGAPYYAVDIQVMPGAPHTTAVSKGVQNLDPTAVGGITIFDDSTPRPTSAPGEPALYDSIQWSADGTAIYSANSESTSFDFYTLSVDASGVVLDQDYWAVFWNPGRIHYDSSNGLVYSDDGFHVVDPATGLPVGLIEVGGGWPMAPDSTLGAVFMLDQYIWQGPNYTISVYDIAHYTNITKIPFSTTPNGITRLGRFIRWGANGLALNDTAGNVYLFSGSFVNGNVVDRHGNRSRKH